MVEESGGYPLTPGPPTAHHPLEVRLKAVFYYCWSVYLVDVLLKDDDGTCFLVMLPIIFLSASQLQNPLLQPGESR